MRFYMDQLFYKPAGEVIHTPWHQDTCYYNVAGDDLVRAWVSPDDVPRDRGIEVVRGSHRWNVTYRPFVGRDPASDPDGAARAKDKFENQEPIIGVEAHQQLSYEEAFMDDTLPALPEIEGQSSFDILGWDYQPGDLLLFHGHILHSASGGVHAPQHAALWQPCGRERMCTTCTGAAGYPGPQGPLRLQAEER